MAAAATPALSRALTSLAWGAAAVLLIKNADGISLYAREVARTTLHFVSRPEFGPGSGGDVVDARLERLLAGASKKSDAALAANASTRVALLALTTAGAALVVYNAGWTFSEMWWVTRRHFGRITEDLKAAVGAVASALARVRGELLERIGMVDANVERARNELALVGTRVDQVGDTLTSVEARLGTIEDEIKRANRGIGLLCDVASTSSTPATSKAVQELAAFKVSTATAATPVAGSTHPQQHQQRAAVSAHSSPDAAGGKGIGSDPTTSLRAQLASKGIFAAGGGGGEILS